MTRAPPPAFPRNPRGRLGFPGRECRRNSRKTTWFPPLGKMRPLPATASQGKSPCSALKGETVPDSLPATPKSPPLIQHPAAAVHADGVTAAEIGLQVGAVAAALVAVALEGPVLVESDLQNGRCWEHEAICSPAEDAATGQRWSIRYPALTFPMLAKGSRRCSLGAVWD